MVLSINVLLFSRHMIGDAGYAYVPTKSTMQILHGSRLAFQGLEDSDLDWLLYPCHPTFYCAIASKLVTARCLAMQLDVSCLSLLSKAIEGAV